MTTKHPPAVLIVLIANVEGKLARTALSVLVPLKVAKEVNLRLKGRGEISLS